MREINWDRPCHKTKHDSKFWLAASSMLEETYLLQHELKILSETVRSKAQRQNTRSKRQVQLIDFKNSCSPSIIQAMSTRMSSNQTQIECACPNCEANPSWLQDLKSENGEKMLWEFDLRIKTLELQGKDTPL